MRISDGSSDVCSSDLLADLLVDALLGRLEQDLPLVDLAGALLDLLAALRERLQEGDLLVGHLEDVGGQLGDLARRRRLRGRRRRGRGRRGSNGARQDRKSVVSGTSGSVR